MANDSDPFGAWLPWHSHEVAHFFSPLAIPWWIAGGWAIDLFLGMQTRDHDDIDVQFLRRDQQSIRALFQGWDIQEAHPTTSPDSWPFHEWKPGTLLSPGIHDIWCRPHKTDPWAIQLMATDTHDDQWILRHNAQFTGSLSTIGYLTDDGIPYLAPEIQLLYKARSPRPKDEADLDRVLPYLDQKSRQWLTQALTSVHPCHPWLVKLENS